MIKWGGMSVGKALALAAGMTSAVALAAAPQSILPGTAPNPASSPARLDVSHLVLRAVTPVAN